MLMRNDCKFRDYSASYVTCFKIDMTKRISDHQSDSLLPPFKDDFTQLGKTSSHFALQLKYGVSLL